MSFPGQTSIHQGSFYNRDFFPKKINQSLRFNDDDTAYLSWTPGSDGNLKTWTWSCWLKKGNIDSTFDMIFTAEQDGTDKTQIYIDDNSKLNLYGGGASAMHLVTTQVFRDPSSWYHIVVAVDTTQVTPSNRVKIYVNGSQVTAFDTETYPTLNISTYAGGADNHAIGVRATQVDFPLDGYLAEVHFVDGAAYGPEYFGVEVNGVWTPITPPLATVDYGTNGFYLDFADSSDIGNNKNSTDGTNDWTPNNLAASDVVSDSPTNSFATLNPITGFLSSSFNGTPAGSLSDGNLRATGGGSQVSYAWASTVAASSGKFYAEFIPDSQNYVQFGVGSAETWWQTYGQGGAYKGQIWGDGVVSWDRTIYYINSTTSTGGGVSFSGGNVCQIAFDADTRKVWFGVNNVWNGSGDPSAGTGEIGIVSGDDPLVFICRPESTSVTANFGQSAFTYTPPAGFKTLALKNVPEPSPEFTFRGGNRKPSDYFTPFLYQGDGGSSTSFTGLGFQPDFLWVKNRTGTYEDRDHKIIDSVRGPTNVLSPSVVSGPSAGAETTVAGDYTLDSDGFTFGGDYGFNPPAGTTSVAWAWKAGGAPATDNVAGTGAVPTAGSVKIDGVNSSEVLAGDIAATRISASRTAGFSIVSFTGNGGSTQTVAHGLSQPLDLLIVKNRTDNDTNHQTWHSGLNADKNIFFNLTNNESTDGPLLFGNGTNNVVPTSTVFTVHTNNQVNGSGDSMIAWCWHSVPGFSKLGSYVGNGNSNGPFVFTGFKPQWLMVKKIDGAGVDGWTITDSKRDTINVMDQRVQAQSSSAEAGDVDLVDFLSNGFKIRYSGQMNNLSGATYIYMAFAEDPYNFANAR